jgi:hypothetical protein
MAAATTIKVAAINKVEVTKTDTKKITVDATSMNAEAATMISFGTRMMTTMTIILGNNDKVQWKTGLEARKDHEETMTIITMTVMMEGLIVVAAVIKVASIRITEGRCHIRNSTMVVARATKTIMVRIRDGSVAAMIDVMMTTGGIGTTKEVHEEVTMEATPISIVEAVIEAATEAATEVVTEVVIEAGIEAISVKTNTRGMTSAHPMAMVLEREKKRDTVSKINLIL